MNTHARDPRVRTGRGFANHPYIPLKGRRGVPLRYGRQNSLALLYFGTVTTLTIT